MKVTITDTNGNTKVYTNVDEIRNEAAVGPNWQLSPNEQKQLRFFKRYSYTEPWRICMIVLQFPYGRKVSIRRIDIADMKIEKERWIN